MVATNQDIGGSDEPYYEGDTLEITVTVTEEGSAKPIDGATIEWALAKDAGGTETLTEGDTGVTTAITDAANGKLEVVIDEGVTDGLSGIYEHEVRLTDSTGDKSVVTKGSFSIYERLNN